MEGVLAYRGYAIEDLVGKHTPRCGFEESSYLLLFGELPDCADLPQY
jgi:citrate synthase